MIKAVFFDIDNTLYSETQAHGAAWLALTRYVWDRFAIDAETWQGYYSREMAQMKDLLGPQAAIHNRMIRFQRILEKLRLPLSHAKIMNDLYWNALLEAARPEPHIEDCLADLKERGYLLGIGTNMTLDWQMAKLQKLELTDYFSLILSSEEAGCEKPDPRFFRLCAHKAGVETKECLFVGDSLKGDILGAEAAGMRALWYAPKEGDLSAHAGFTRYSQLQNLISVV